MPAYANNVAGLTLDDVNAQEFQVFLEQKETQLVQAASTAGTSLPSHPIPDETRTLLEDMNNAGDLKAARGELGNSRISILSAYGDH